MEDVRLRSHVRNILQGYVRANSAATEGPNKEELEKHKQVAKERLGKMLCQHLSGLRKSQVSDILGFLEKESRIDGVTVASYADKLIAKAGEPVASTRESAAPAKESKRKSSEI